MEPNLLCMPTAPKGLAHGSRSADIGVGRPYNSPGLYCYGEAPGKPQSHQGSQQRIPQGYRGGKLNHCMHLISNTSPQSSFSIISHPQELGIITDYYTYVCSSPTRDIFLGILYGYKMLLQVIALVLAFSTRKVKVKGLDDSKYIAAATYVTSIVLAVIIVATYSLKDFVNAFPALFCTGFLIGTTFILGLVFIPKVGGCEAGDCLCVCARISELSIF